MNKFNDIVDKLNKMHLDNLLKDEGIEAKLVDRTYLEYSLYLAENIELLDNYKEVEEYLLEEYHNIILEMKMSKGKALEELKIKKEVWEEATQGILE